MAAATPPIAHRNYAYGACLEECAGTGPHTPFHPLHAHLIAKHGLGQADVSALVSTLEVYHEMDHDPRLLPQFQAQHPADDRSTE